MLEHKRLYSKCNDGAGEDHQHLKQDQNIKAKFAFTALCLGLWGSKSSMCFKQLNGPTILNTYFKVVLDLSLK